MTDEVQRIVRELRERPPAWRASDDCPDLRGACNLPDGHRYDGSCALCRCGDRPEALEVIVTEVLRLARPSVPEAPTIPEGAPRVFNRVPEGYERSKWEDASIVSPAPSILERRPICPSCGVIHNTDAQPAGNPWFLMVRTDGSSVLNPSWGYGRIALALAVVESTRTLAATGMLLRAGTYSAWLDQHEVLHLAWWDDGQWQGGWQLDLDDPADSNGEPWLQVDTILADGPGWRDRVRSWWRARRG